MGADVVECAEFVVRSAHDEDRIAADLDFEVITGARHLLLDTGKLPALGPELLMLAHREASIGVATLWDEERSVRVLATTSIGLGAKGLRGHGVLLLVEPMATGSRINGVEPMATGSRVNGIESTATGSGIDRP
jgi:hypothetical protein